MSDISDGMAKKTFELFAHGPEHHVIADLAARLAKAERALEETTAENNRLRAALANSELACVYCTLPKDEWAKCADGFPGCSRADDAMGCPELGAMLRAEAAERALEEAEKVIKPFAATAEHDIGESETDDDMFRPMLAYNRAPRLTVGHLRAARKWMESRHD